MTLEKKCEAGLWFDVAAAKHYKVANFSDGSSNKFLAMARSKIWSNRKNLERHFGTINMLFKNKTQNLSKRFWRHCLYKVLFQNVL
jgi:hypothetical protein